MNKINNLKIVHTMYHKTLFTLIILLVFSCGSKYQVNKQEILKNKGLRAVGKRITDSNFSNKLIRICTLNRIDRGFVDKLPGEKGSNNH